MGTAMTKHFQELARPQAQIGDGDEIAIFRP
jgi:hypothetical protein